jgi:hypothetical protein
LDNLWPSQKKQQIAGSGGSAEVEALKEKLRKLEEEHQKDRDFYEEALEARMNQMDELE